MGIFKFIEYIIDPDVKHCDMGLMFLKGEGVDRDFDEGIHWLQKSAKSGNGYSMLVLGNFYFYGESRYPGFLEHFGVPYDEEKAFYWYKKQPSEKILKTAIYESQERFLENE
uniref:FOG: TPR repeat, SEL1 subfamily n=2 Tax=Gammaproteobacteria TaxID=1236 RepID=E7C6U5_9GAMM|nr:hypothetical protein [uncultured Oceanospirillales bacterium HF0500_29K23]ADI23169.1 hypothetical protein [uncultured gamma proteobacterium HF0770_11A05]